jgi:hypothetical protein
MISRRTALTLALTLPILACAPKMPTLHPGETPQMRTLIRKWAKIHDIPESLLHRIIQRESDYNAAARNGFSLFLFIIKHKVLSVGHKFTSNLSYYGYIMSRSRC